MDASPELIGNMQWWEAGPEGNATPARVAYWDAIGHVWTIGFGETEGVREGDTMTIAEAIARLSESVAKRARMLSAPGVLNVELTQNRFDGIVSILYNAGPGKPGVHDGIIWLADGRQSSLLRCANAEAWDLAATKFDAWNKAGGVVVNGLINRRKSDRYIFQLGDYSVTPNNVKEYAAL